VNDSDLIACLLFVLVVLLAATALALLHRVS
jgi:hypothetical protein